MYSDSVFKHPDITEEMWPQIDAVIEKYKSTPGAVITVLRLCQNVVGYLPIELIDYIANGINLPSSDVIGVATFYALFSLVPKGRNVVRACTGTACYVKGIKEVIDRIEGEYKIGEGDTTPDRRFSLECVRCLGACGLAPVLVVNSDVHGAVKADKIIEILDNYN